MSEHTTGVFHPTRYDGYVARCSCGWASEEMAYAGAALKKGHEHEGKCESPSMRRERLYHEALDAE